MKVFHTTCDRKNGWIQGKKRQKLRATFVRNIYTVNVITT